MQHKNKFVEKAGCTEDLKILLFVLYPKLVCQLLREIFIIIRVL